MIDHRSYTHNLNSCDIKDWKNSDLNGIRSYDLCDTGALLYQMSHQAIWELITSWVHKIPAFKPLPTELSSQLGADYIVSS